MELRPYSSRPNLCTVIDFAGAKAARAVGLSTGSHVFHVPGFSVGDLVACADGAEGRIRVFKGHMVVVALNGLFGTLRAADISTLRKLPEPGDAA